MQIPSWNSSMTLLLGKSPNTSASRLLQQDSYLYSLSYLFLVKLWQKQFHEYLSASTAQNAHPSLIFLITSVQSCPTLCDPIDCSMPGFPIYHQHPEPTQTTCSLCHWCHPNISSSVVLFSSHLQSFPASGSFQISQFFPSGGQSIEVSTSASVLPLNIQYWFPLGGTGWISLQSKRHLGVLSNTTVQKHQFSSAHLSL